MIILDGVKYSKIGIVSIRRSFDVQDGDNTIQAKSGVNLRDIVGTRYNYVMELGSYVESPEEYDNFFEAITAPVPYHTLEVPYGQGTMTFEAEVYGGQDELLSPLNVRQWGKLRITFSARRPQRRG